MWTGSYELLPQREPNSGRTSGFFGPGTSFDYIPRVHQDDFSDASQSCVSRMCNLIVTSLVYVITFVTFPLSGWFVLKSVPNYQRVVVFRLGRVCAPKGPGVVLVLPLIDQWQRVDLRTRAFNIPPCQVETRDGGLLSVGADIQFRIWNPVLSVVSVQDLNASTRMTAQSALTHSLAKKTAREVQAERLKLGEYLGVDINERTKPWGLEVDRVELTLGSVVKEPAPSGAPVAPPAVPGLEGLAGPMQQLAMHILGHASGPASSDDLQQVLVTSPGSVQELLEDVERHLSAALVARVGACFQLHVRSEDGGQRSYYVDLSQGSGAVGPGSLGRPPDVTLTLSEVDLLAVFQRRLTPLEAYSRGRLQVQGDLQTALRLQELVTLLR